MRLSTRSRKLEEFLLKIEKKGHIEKISTGVGKGLGLDLKGMLAGFLGGKIPSSSSPHTDCIDINHIDK